MNNNINNDTIDIQQVLDMIPHRYPMLLVDRITQIQHNQSAIGLKNITFNEPQFQGHFPGAPVMPGVMIIESMAQTAAALIVYSLELKADNKLIYFMTIDDARFRRPVEPGDSMYIHVEKEHARGTVWKFSGTATVDDQLCAQARFSAMVVDKK
jgi:3-hydroxyacyl-[acyl-carrier-protein] dehydratase